MIVEAEVKEISTEPVKLAGGWFVKTPNGDSGPWPSKSAALMAKRGRYEEARKLHLVGAKVHGIV